MAAKKTDAPAEEVITAEEVAAEDAAATKKASTIKVYHISKRKDDGMWQVKLAGGAKAIKLFKTQAEAIDLAKSLADSQDGRIVIHKEDGSFRKLTYSKK